MAKIDFDVVLERVNDSNDLIISCDSPVHIREGEVLHLSNFPHEQYVLYIRSGNKYNGPCSNRSVLRSNTSLTQKLADTVFRRGINDRLYIVDMQIYSFDSDDYLKMVTPVITVEHGISVTLSFSVNISIKYRINPKNIQEILRAYIKRDIVSANEYLFHNLRAIIQAQTEVYINSFFENVIAINTYKETLDTVGQIHANSEILTNNIRNAISTCDELKYYAIEIVSASVLCNDSETLRDKSNIIPEIESKAEIEKIEQKKKNELLSSQQAADIEAASREHDAELARDRKTFDQNQEQALINAKKQQEIERILLAIDTEKQNQQISIDMRRQREQLVIDTEQKVIDMSLNVIQVYLDQIAQAALEMHNSLNIYIDAHPGMEVELQPFISQLKQLHSLNDSIPQLIADQLKGIQTLPSSKLIEKKKNQD